MNSDEIVATVIDMSAKVEALEALIIGYIGISERRSVSCESFVGYFEMYLDILRKTIVSQSPLLSKSTASILDQKIDIAQKRSLNYQKWGKLADSVEDFRE